MARAGRRANGEGAPRQRADGVWEVRFYVIDPRTGERKRVSAYGKRRVDAINKMREMVDRAERGAPLKDASGTVGRWIEQWTETTLQVLPMSDNYRDQTRNLARNHLMVGPFAERRLDQLRPTGVESLLAELSRRTKLKEVGGRQVEVRALSDSTIRSIFLVLRKALDAAVRDGLISRNPAHEVASPRVGRRRVTKLDGPDVVRLLGALRSNRYYAAFALIAATGVRRGEALALAWSDVDLDTRVAEIHLTLSQVKGGTRESPAKTDGSRRQVVIPETVAVLLRQWRKRQAAERLRAGKAWVGGDKVFTTPTGGVVHPRNFLRDLQEAARELGLPDGVGVHTLRHSAATAMLEAGVHVKAVADSLGHSSAQITLDIYGFTADKVARAAAEGLAATFGITADEEPEEDGGATVIALR
ncbi:integrase [Actinotalea ferrariae CF5-4]|uniref:Integrase n=1 Tax=Actinotalea ferrariae CF5-4 TaxID=948458 RepID=A0A021VUS2_9CELL|nr:tyrosine-type recombinase/integrase [Actinotalea ferrariae]EYR64853.1 integrase [Actinotalea ferrariae CF5-4]